MSVSPLLTSMPHLLRPLWLFALLALPALWWLWRRHARSDTPWKRAVDPHLLPSLLQAAEGSTHAGAWLFGVAYLLAVFALAGPAWRQAVTLYTPQAPLVVVMDLSSHMLVADLPPSRLLRARLKIQQLIALRKGGQLGLIAYAGDAFTVAPLSDDANSLRDLLAALTTDTMPVDGQRADTALHRATDLLVHAGFAHGTILLLSDDADAAAQAAARDVHAKGYDVDVIGVGTAAGAPLPAPDGSFAQDATGAMRIARLDVDALRALAQAGGGRYAGLAGSSDDLNALGVLDNATKSTASVAADALGWRDCGPFLLLALLPLVALGFRRGWLAVALLAVFALPAQRAQASETNAWNALWQRADQRADHALRIGDTATANALAQTPAQRAAAAYRGGDFSTAARTWSTLDSANGNYNRGNALAQLKHYPEAIAAYRRALQLHPGMTDAQANLKLVEQLQKKQQEKKQQQNSEQQDQQQNQQQGQKQQDQNGQSKNRENMQKSQQQGQQQQQQQQQNQQQQNQQGQQNPKQKQQGQQDQQQRQGKDQQQRDPKQQDKEAQQDQPSQSAPDQKKQAQADTAERRAMQQALQHKNQPATQRTPVAVHESDTQREQREATDALLQRVPDDPGALLRRKFALEYARHQQEGDK